MDYHLHHLVIHELIKSSEEGEAQLFLSEQLLPIEERAEQLTQRLHRTFSQKNDVLQGQLSSPEDALFPGYFQHLIDEQITAPAFLQFSRDSMQALQLSLQGVTGAKGGYLVYAYYTLAERSYLSIFLVRDAEGIVFQKKNEAAFSLSETTYLNIDKMAMACRIPIHDQQAGDPHRVEVIKHARSQKDISDYFLAWIAMEESNSSRHLTTTFLEAVAAIEPPIDQESGSPVDSGVFREKVAQFALKNPAKTINIQAFEDEFYGNEQPLQNYFSNQNIDLQNEFRFDRQALRDYHFHKFKSQGMYFGCKHAFLLSGKVRVEGQQVIIDDEDLAEQILDLLRP